MYYCMYVVMETGCQPEYDEFWDIQWQLTPAGTVAEGQCPDELEGNVQNIDTNKMAQITIFCMCIYRLSLQIMLPKLHMGYSNK